MSPGSIFCLRILAPCAVFEKGKGRKPCASGLSDCRKTYITKRVVRPTPINPQKAATCAWLFALLKGGAPRWSGGRTAILSLVRCPDGHTFFAFLRTTGPARERSMGAEALRQPLAKTRKSGLSHFFDTLKKGPLGPFCFD